MGKFGTYKRLETLLSAFDALRKNSRFADVELWIGGTDHPNTPGYLRGLAAHRSGDAGIRFLGYLPEEDIPDFFENARISVFDYESTTGSSGVLHQTASYGAVPIFPALGDFIEVSQDEGLIGRNFAPGDAAGLADAIGAVLDDPAGSELAARSNRQAALGFPMSKVARFHVERLATHCRVQRKAAAVPAADGAF
jgi:glycosyltransferase involved in cell wall biosynthesis